MSASSPRMGLALIVVFVVGFAAFVVWDQGRGRGGAAPAASEVKAPRSSAPESGRTAEDRNPERREAAAPDEEPAQAALPVGQRDM